TVAAGLAQLEELERARRVRGNGPAEHRELRLDRLVGDRLRGRLRVVEHGLDAGQRVGELPAELGDAVTAGAVVAPQVRDAVGEQLVVQADAVAVDLVLLRAAGDACRVVVLDQRVRRAVEGPDLQYDVAQVGRQVDRV